MLIPTVLLLISAGAHARPEHLENLIAVGSAEHVKEAVHPDHSQVVPHVDEHVHGEHPAEAVHPDQHQVPQVEEHHQMNPVNTLDSLAALLNPSFWRDLGATAGRFEGLFGGEAHDSHAHMEHAPVPAHEQKTGYGTLIDPSFYHNLADASAHLEQIVGGGAPMEQILNMMRRTMGMFSHMTGPIMAPMEPHHEPEHHEEPHHEEAHTAPVETVTENKADKTPAVPEHHEEAKPEHAEEKKEEHREEKKEEHHEEAKPTEQPKTTEEHHEEAKPEHHEEKKEEHHEEAKPEHHEEAKPAAAAEPAHHDEPAKEATAAAPAKP